MGILITGRLFCIHIFKMILAGVISRGTTILAKYIQVAGSNMNEFIDEVLAKVTMNSDARNHNSHGEFLIYYISERGIVYLAIAQQDIPQENVFRFLEEVKEKFQRYVGDRARSALANEFEGEWGTVLKNGMLKATPSQLDIINKDMDEVKGYMVKSIDAALQRGEKMDDLLDKTDELQTNAGTFKRQAVQIQRHMWWENKKMTAIGIGGAILLVYIIVSSACGGPAWPNCV